MQNLKLLILLLIMLNFSCSSLNNKYSNDCKRRILLLGKVDYVNIHKNANSGDYSIQSDGNVKYREIKIDKIENDKIYISERDYILSRKSYSPLTFHFKSKFYREFITERNGKVIDTYLVNEDINNREKLVTANFYISGIADDNFNQYNIKTMAGTFKCRLHYRIIRYEDKEYYFIIYTSDEVKFNIVQEFSLSKKDYEKFKHLSIKEKEDFEPDRFMAIFEQGNKL